MNKTLRLIKQWVSELIDGKGEAVHVCSGNHHAVTIAEMRVIIVKDGENTWFAQSLDIDYAASGISMSDVQNNFEVGLSSTIKAHLDRFGNIDKIMRSPPFEDWVHLLSYDVNEFEVSMNQTHSLVDEVLSNNLPYKNISYIEPMRKAA